MRKPKKRPRLPWGASSQLKAICHAIESDLRTITRFIEFIVPRLEGRSEEFCDKVAEILGKPCHDFFGEDGCEKCPIGKTIERLWELIRRLREVKG